MVKSSSYRADIDGLRAVAVISVMLYHYFPKVLPGGFLGVDVFFVISGYLISNLLFADSHFSIFKFYARRIRRIFPALTLLLVASLILGFFLLYADEYRSLGLNTLAAAGFYSNILLWNEIDYFNPASSLKPLLHLWSLGIEEQYYIFYPLVLYAWRRNRAVLLSTLLGLSIGGYFLFSAEHATFAFYWPVTRMWELLAGAHLAHFHSVGRRVSPRYQLAFSTGGFVVLLFSLFRPDFLPSEFWVLLSTIGSAAIIWAGPDQGLNKAFLSRSWMVKIGLISYPLYLWHWTVLSFLKIVESGAPSDAEVLTALGLSFVLAFLTYRFFEKPIRHAKSPATPLKLIGAMALIAGAAILIVLNNGFEHRFDSERMNNQSVIKKTAEWGSFFSTVDSCGVETKFSKIPTWCMKSAAGQPTALLWGDSHAEHLFPGLKEIDAKRNWLLLGQMSCPPMLGVKAYSLGSDQKVCGEFNQTVIKILEDAPEIKEVVLSFLGPFYISDTPFAWDHTDEDIRKFKLELDSGDLFPGVAVRTKADILEVGIENSVEALVKLGKRIAIAKDIPEMPFRPEQCLGRPFSLSHRQCLIDRATVSDRQKAYLNVIDRVVQKFPQVAVFDPTSIVCNSEACSMGEKASFIYRDSHHLSLYGSQVVGKEFVKWLNTLPGEQPR